MKSIILAAGKGSRLSPITDTVPKTLVPISSAVTILDHILNQLPQEITEVCVVTGYLSEKVEDHLKKRNDDFSIQIRKQTELNGTWGALCVAQDFIDPGEKFLVIHGDDIHQSKHISAIIKHKRAYALQKITTVSSTVRIENGLIAPGNPEKQSDISYITTAMYVLDCDVFTLKPVRVSTSEYGLPHTLIRAYPEYKIDAYIEGGWIQINSHEDLEKAKIQLEQRPEEI